jgi:hypothetical protein
MHLITLTLRLDDGSRHIINTTSSGTIAALIEAETLYPGLRGGSAKILALKAPGVELPAGTKMPTVAANEARFGLALA